MQTEHIDMAIETWLETKFRISSSQETRKLYKEIIVNFRAWLQRAGVDLDPEVWAGTGDRAKKRAVARLASEAQKFALSAKRKPIISDRTYALRLSVLSSFYDFAIKRDFFDILNPISKIERPRTQPYGKVLPLDISDVSRKMQSIDRSNARGARDYTLLAVLLQTGRRLAEVAGLRWKHVKLARGRLEDLESVQDIRLALIFERCKGGDMMQHELSNWLSVELLKSLGLTYEMNPLYLDPARPLWPATRGRYKGAGLGRRGIAYIVQQRLGTAAVHRLRHTNALALREVGLSLEEIQKLLGHKHLATTAVYLPSLSATRNPKVVEVDKALLGV